MRALLSVMSVLLLSALISCNKSSPSPQQLVKYRIPGYGRNIWGVLSCDWVVSNGYTAGTTQTYAVIQGQFTSNDSAYAYAGPITYDGQLLSFNGLYFLYVDTIPFPLHLNTSATWHISGSAAEPQINYVSDTVPPQYTGILPSVVNLNENFNVSIAGYVLGADSAVLSVGNIASGYTGGGGIPVAGINTIDIPQHLLSSFTHGDSVTIKLYLYTNRVETHSGKDYMFRTSYSAIRSAVIN